MLTLFALTTCPKTPINHVQQIPPIENAPGKISTFFKIKPYLVDLVLVKHSAYVLYFLYPNYY